MKLIRMIVVITLFLSMMQVPYSAIFAEENNYALVYFQHPQEIETHTVSANSPRDLFRSHSLQTNQAFGRLSRNQ